ncbi:hypothetical protein [Paenibacillus sp. FSL R7-0652]|uniref:hypothetical protein n=1 Tax=Paenibacillus sp. FSL R7-0652 TaxID=2921687 RepID=UPI00315A37D6
MSGELKRLKSLKPIGPYGHWDRTRTVSLEMEQKRTSPTPVQVPNMKDVVGVASGESASYAVKADGSVWPEISGDADGTLLGNVHITEEGP